MTLKSSSQSEDEGLGIGKSGQGQASDRDAFYHWLGQETAEIIEGMATRGEEGWGGD